MLPHVLLFLVVSYFGLTGPEKRSGWRTRVPDCLGAFVVPFAPSLSVDIAVGSVGMGLGYFYTRPTIPAEPTSGVVYSCASTAGIVLPGCRCAHPLRVVELGVGFKQRS